jgi:serine carboxypeptidase-like clade 2
VQVEEDGVTVSLNHFAWNMVANVLYVDSPAGVGFSYTQNASDYDVGDARTAADLVVFLQGFLQRYPQFQANDFWVTGESYGGKYVPNLALAILEANAAGGAPRINLKGFQVGNAWTEPPLDNAGAPATWYTHHLISDETYNGIMSNCDFSTIGPLVESAAEGRRGAPRDACQDYLNEANAAMARINIYQIYEDVCDPPNTTMPSSDGEMLLSLLRRARNSAHRAASPDLVPDTVVPPPDPCLTQHVGDYLNLPAVQAAIHANISYPYYGCSPFVNYSYADVLASEIPVYQKLLAAQPPLQILVFSGDVDGIVPTAGTRAWLSKYFGGDVVKPWRPWFDTTGQTGGYVTVYEGLTFATVRGAGHMVPGTQPQRSLDLFSRFLAGQPI